MDIKSKRIATLSPVAWRTPPRAYGAWETVAGNITEGLVARGWKDVTLFATKESQTSDKLAGWVERGYEEDKSQVPLVSMVLHISKVMERGGQSNVRRNSGNRRTRGPLPDKFEVPDRINFIIFTEKQFYGAPVKS